VPSNIKQFVLDSICVEEAELEDSWPFIQRLLKSGKIVMFFDGLDEITYDQQVLWRSFFEKIKKMYADCKVIASCRSGSLNVDFPGFKHVEVLPFLSENVSEYIDSWFGPEGIELAGALKLALNSESDVNELSRSPLLLSLLCVLFENELDLPHHKTDLFSRCVEALLHKWDSSRGFRRETVFSQLSLAKRKRVFQRVAMEFSLKDKSILKDTVVSSVVGQYLQKFDVEPELSGSVLSELESHHGLLIRPAANVFSFSHLSFQDYFSAEYLISTRRELEFSKSYASNSQKKDIIVFCSCLVEDADELVCNLLEQSDLRDSQNYPTIARKLSIASVLVRVVASGASMSKKNRALVVSRLAEYFKVAADLFQKTGLNLYCTFSFGKPKIRHTYSKRRETYSEALLSFEGLIGEAIFCNYTPIFDALRGLLLKKVTYSSRALLSSVFIRKDPSLVLESYQYISDLERLPSKYRQKINETIGEVRGLVGSESDS